MFFAEIKKTADRFICVTFVVQCYLNTDMCKLGTEPSRLTPRKLTTNLEPGPSPGFRNKKGQNHKGPKFFKYNIGCMQQPPLWKSLAICKLHSHLNSTQKVIQIWTPNRPSTVICYFATWAKEETRNSISCKSL